MGYTSKTRRKRAVCYAVNFPAFKRVCLRSALRVQEVGWNLCRQYAFSCSKTRHRMRCTAQRQLLLLMEPWAQMRALASCQPIVNRVVISSRSAPSICQHLGSMSIANASHLACHDNAQTRHTPYIEEPTCWCLARTWSSKSKHAYRSARQHGSATTPRKRQFLASISTSILSSRSISSCMIIAAVGVHCYHPVAPQCLFPIQRA